MNKEVSGNERNFYGFFGFAVYGKIENLGLTEVNYNLVNNIEDNAVTGGTGISGIGQYCLGEIVNCYVTGKITETVNSAHDVYCAGIVCNNWGTIENSYNLATINGILTTESIERASFSAGIAIHNEAEKAKIRNCYNLGEIKVKANSGVGAGAGGVVCNQTLGTIENCFNIGEINCEIIEKVNGYSRVGGVVSWITGGEVKNVYNCGTININSEDKNIYVGGVVGENRKNLLNAYNIGKINNINSANNCWIGEIFGVVTEEASSLNSFYIDNQPIGHGISEFCNISKITSDELKGDEILDILNQNGAFWKKDINNINKGYPILYWQ